MYRSVVGIGGVSGGQTGKHGSSRRMRTEGHRRRQRTRKEGRTERRVVVGSGGVSGGRTRKHGSGVVGGDGVDGGVVVVVGNEQDVIIKEGWSEWGKKDGKQVESGVGGDGRGRRRDGTGKKADGDRFERRLP
jgi:hypothetical protein